ncbi:MAG: OmpA family protein [Bacteroidales bacterium]|nr:OmpA family protein [Bacteroidales bacterium]
MKKIFKFALMVSLLMASTSVFAQNTGKPEYPRYGFWSNWSVGASIDYNHELAVNSNATSWGMDIFAQQKLNHVFDYRFRLGMPTLFSTQPELADGETLRRENHWTFTLDIMISLNNALLGYDPDRRFSFYLFGGPGAKFNDKLGLISNLDSANAARENTQRSEKGRGMVMMTLGQGISYRLGDSWNLFCEYSFDATDLVNIFSDEFYKWHDVNSIVRLGASYCFGVTAADQAVAAQKAMLSQENFGALNTQVNNLENQVAASRNNEKKLENRIAELEDQLAEARANQGQGQNNGANSEAAKELQATIDQIKADQLNFYAMPFSVQYDVNEWKVSDDEMDKVKAVARVLKDNPDVKIMVVGFADYTGSDQYNMKLSERRANEVKRLLTKKYGIAEDRISTDYKGKSVAFGDIQYALNRRVSFYRVID